MARKQIGTEYLVFIDISETETPSWKVPLCQTSLTVNTPMNVIDASSKCGSDSMIESAAETVDFEGQILQQDATNTSHMSLFDLRQLYREKRLVKFKVGPKGATAADDGKIVYSFTGYISNLSDTYGTSEVGTVSGSIAVSGEITETEFEFTP